MAVATTSLLAYQSIKHLGEKQTTVLAKIEEIQPCSNRQIAKALNWEINRVTGRVNELAKLGLIKTERTRIGATGRPEKIWQLNEL
jgi:predicted ArsR family transcriptional regulator